jgi:hypothetical protein
VCLHAHDEVSGKTLSLWRDELLASTRLPFDSGPDSVMVAYASNAELQCFLSLGLPFPTNVLDPYVETIVAINGNTAVWPPADEKNRKGRPGLLDALKLHGLPARPQEEKDRMRDMILGNEDYTPEQRHEIQDIYNPEDVNDTIALLGALGGPVDNIDHALFRGRYMAAAARMERVGLPVDGGYLNPLMERWEALQLYYIQQHDEFHLYDGAHFVEARLWDLVEAKGWDWPRTPTGRYQLTRKTIGRQATRYPELKSLARLRDQIAELRINKLGNTVGPDGFSRCIAAVLDRDRQKPALGQGQDVSSQLADLAARAAQAATRHGPGRAGLRR